MAQSPTSAQSPEWLFDNHTNTLETFGYLRLLIATYVHGEDEERKDTRHTELSHIHTPRRLSLAPVPA